MSKSIITPNEAAAAARLLIAWGQQAGPIPAPPPQTSSGGTPSPAGPGQAGSGQGGGAGGGESGGGR